MPSDDDNQHRLLMIAFHFPPQVGSSGALRALSFTRYLPDFGWNPTVLTARSGLYPATDPAQLKRIPANTRVIRAIGFDANRQLSFRGRYFRWSAMPDRWASWALGAVPAAIAAIRRDNCRILLTTYPIATSVLIGLAVHAFTHIPWVLDLRDPITDEGYPPDPQTRRVFLWLERQAIHHATRVIFTANAARETYLARYPSLRPENCVTVSNGFDEPDFADLNFRAASCSTSLPLRLVHSGLIYPEERDPRPFFLALGKLKRSGTITASTLQIDLRASGHDDFCREHIINAGVDDIVRLLPPLPYRASLQDAANADALLLLQSAWCDAQIPAKAYEYLRIGKPILALTSDTGETARLLRETGGTSILDLSDEDAIVSGLPDFLQRVRSGNHDLPAHDQVAFFNRRNQAGALAAVLDGVIAQ